MGMDSDDFSWNNSDEDGDFFGDGLEQHLQSVFGPLFGDGLIDVDEFGRMVFVQPRKVQGGLEAVQFTRNGIGSPSSNVHTYLPGTFLLSYRFSPEEIWLTTTNSTATFTSEGNRLSIDYQSSALPDLKITGGIVLETEFPPTITWELEIENTSGKSIEIGEISFPCAWNVEIFPSNSGSAQLSAGPTLRVWTSVLGGSSFQICGTSSGDGPSILMLPGPGSPWEFSSTLPGGYDDSPFTIGTPCVYIYSKAVKEREGWEDSPYESTSCIMEPGETKTYRLRFIYSPTTNFADIQEYLFRTGHPIIQVRPCPVVPVGAPVNVTIQGVRAAEFQLDQEIEFESESDDPLSICSFTSETPGPLKVTIVDTEGNLHWVSVYFTEKLETLIQKRAEWLTKHQIPTLGAFKHSFRSANLSDQSLVSDEEYMQSRQALRNMLGEALFLAEKTLAQPLNKHLTALEKFYSNFLLKKVIRPGSYTIGSRIDLETTEVATDFGDSFTAILGALLCLKLARLDDYSGKEAESQQKRAVGVSLAVQALGIGSASSIDELWLVAFQWFFTELHRAAERHPEEYANLKMIQSYRGHLNVQTEYWQNMRFKELGANWWERGTSGPFAADEIFRKHPFVAASTLGATSSWSLQGTGGYDSLESSRSPMPVAPFNFAGAMSVWTLVRPDGACSSYVVTDLASTQVNFEPHTGEAGLALFGSMQSLASFVNLAEGDSIGATVFQYRDIPFTYRIRPWTGTNNLIVIPDLDMVVRCNCIRMESILVPINRRWIGIKFLSSRVSDMIPTVEIQGLWGTSIQVQGKTFSSNSNGRFVVPLSDLDIRSGDVLFEVVNA